MLVDIVAYDGVDELDVVGPLAVLRRARATDRRLEVRLVSTHHGALVELADLGVDVVRERVVDEGDPVTSGGVTSGPDLALGLVARNLGDDLAASVALAIEYQWFRPKRGA